MPNPSIIVGTCRVVAIKGVAHEVGYKRLEDGAIVPAYVRQLVFCKRPITIWEDVHPVAEWSPLVARVIQLAKAKSGM